MARSNSVRGTDCFANLEKVSLFRGLFKILRATRFEAVPTGVAIPPMAVPTASAQASGASGMPAVLDMDVITGTNTVTSGTLSTTWEMRADNQSTSVTERARFPLETCNIWTPA